MNKRKVNEAFFDTPSREMMYVLGASYAAAVPIGERGLEFRNQAGSLIDILRYHFDSSHSVCVDMRTSAAAWLRMSTVPHMRATLEEKGVLVPKELRTVPNNIPSEYASHFVRGFFDARASVGENPSKRNGKYVSFSFNHDFLLGLHALLAAEANLKRVPPKGNRLLYQNGDSKRLHFFMYKDWDFIEKEGLYLPEKKLLLESKLS